MQVKQNDMKHDSVFGNALHVGWIPAHKHSRLRKVQIIGFCSAKSMVELTCHILENATSLESLTLDTIFDQFDQGTVVEHGDCRRRCVQKYSGCGLISREMILEAHEALRVVSIYIIGRVPPAVQLNVRGPCSQCHKVP